MKIAFFLTQYMKIGGVENVVREIAKRLKRKHKVYLIIRDREQNCKPEKFWDGSLIIPNSKKFSQFLKSRKLVEKYVEEQGIEVVNFHNWSPAVPFVFSTFKKVITMHGSSTERLMNNGKWYLTPFMWLVEEFIMNSCNAITSITKYHMKPFWLFRPTYIIYNGVDTAFFSPRKLSKLHTRKELKIKGTTGLYVGKFMHVKGLGYLLSAAKNCRDVDFVVIGDGKEKDLLTNATKNVKWVGPIYDKKVLRKYYRAVDFLVIPSINEGLPLVLLEAMSMDLPIVTTHVGGIPEITSEVQNVVLIKPKSTNSLVNAITSIGNNLNKFENVRRTYTKKNFSWEHITEQYTKVFESVNADQTQKQAI